MRLLNYFPKETESLIAARLKSLNVRPPKDGNGWMLNEVKNGVRTIDFIQAVAWCKLPAIQEALADIAKRTDDPDIKAAATVAAGGAATAVVSAEVAALTEGVVKTMFMTQLKVLCAALIAVAVLGACVITRAQDALARANESRITGAEIAFLNATAEYAHRVHAAQKVCSLGVGVSYETLSGFHTRIQYIGALKAIVTVPSCPLLLRVERVLPGTPLFTGCSTPASAPRSLPSVRMRGGDGISRTAWAIARPGMRRSPIRTCWSASDRWT